MSPNQLMVGSLRQKVSIDSLYAKSESVLEIRVCNPIISINDNGRFTDYEIKCNVFV